jgi:hypothetical protein
MAVRLKRLPASLQQDARGRSATTSWRHMHISSEEAMSLLIGWRNEGTPLEVRLSRSGAREEVRGTIRELRETIVEVFSDSGKLQVDLQGAEFNGDKSAPASSNYAAYLVCEFPNGDRSSFYVLRPTKSSSGPLR